MAPIIPSSLSPHVATLTSPDLDELLKKASLPSLPHILQSFSPLPQVTTRTTTLASVLHASFALRFSDLRAIEEACKEDDIRRAERTIDWITARINHRCAKWVQDMEKDGDKETVSTPWWDELRRCVEGDFVPSKTEGWNHPVAVVLAVSTTTPNPLQAITALHSRRNQLPSWVDTNFLRYTLIIHPKDSALSDEEATALYNAVKKQFGLHSYLLSLVLPENPTPVPVPAHLPRLPHPPSPEPTPNKAPSTPKTPKFPTGPSTSNSLLMAQSDIQEMVRFTREFVLMSLVPWMEKCTLEWNENFSSTRRLPSRFFSSTRRLFGSPSPSPAPSHLPSTGPNFSRSSTLPPTVNGGPIPPSQTRRLAEFSTIMGDFKLANMVWEALRKESKGGADVLPLLLAPTTAIKHFAQAALMSINPNMLDSSPYEQVCALLYAVRWETSIATRDFLNDDVEGERWLVWAASNAEEAPSALLLAQAALLSTKKETYRRAALWYAVAATRLEKCGIKPLTLYFLRKAQELYTGRPQKELSPSFWDSEGKSPTSAEGFEDIISAIEHPLGRLLYTTGDVASAVKLFLGLLRGRSTSIQSVADSVAIGPSLDKLYLEDFRVAFSYLKLTDPGTIPSGSLELPFNLCVGKHSRLRHPGDTYRDAEVWSSRQEDWILFWKSRGGRETVAPAGKYTTDEYFWVDLSLRNPLGADITLTNLSLVVQETGEGDSGSAIDFVEVETIKEVLLLAKESVNVPISLKSTRPAKLNVTHAVYDFLSLMPMRESLACRGRRLHETVLHRQSCTYAPDVLMQVEIMPSDHKLTVKIDDERLVLVQGENRSMKLWLTNSGSTPISEVWMVTGPDDEVWIGSAEDMLIDYTADTEVIESSNSLERRSPHRLPLATALQPGENTEISIILHSESSGLHDLCLLFVFREDSTKSFSSTRFSVPYQVESLFGITANAEPSTGQEYAYMLDLTITNMSPITGVNINDIVCVSPQWRCHNISDGILTVMEPSQYSRFVLGASPWPLAKAFRETHEFLMQRVNKFLKGIELEFLLPPPVELLCSHTFKKPGKSSAQSAAIMNFIHSARWKYTSQHVAQHHSSIPSPFHSSIFPLYNPTAVDFLIFWENPSQHRSGHINLHGLTLGAQHAALDSIIEEAENEKVKRSMYAETRRENVQVVEALSHSEWNFEMNPIVVSVKGSIAEAHDFSTGPCHVPIEFLLRNHSFELPASYTLKLQPGAISSLDMLSPSYTGRLTFRGKIEPLQLVTVRPKVWVSKPGTYSLGGWTLETEISIEQAEGSKQSTRNRRYLQEPSPEDKTCVVICGS